jgi:RNA polymerase sigma-70 factor, ECF subfamily
VRRSNKGEASTVFASDEQLVHRAAHGDTSALGALYDRFAPLVLSMASRLLSPLSEAEDLTQDVFLELWRDAGRYDATRGGVRGWILTKARSRALDRRIKTARQRRAIDPLGPVDGHYVTDDRIGSERRALREAFEQLPPSQRTVLELVYAEGLSTHEVAEQIGTPIGTVKSRIAYGLARLRETLRVTKPVARVAPPRP